MTGTFIDTIIICTMTGLVLVVSGVWTGDFEWCGYDSICFCNGFPCNGKIFIDDRFSVILLLLLFWVGIITVNAALNTFLARKVSCLIV